LLARNDDFLLLSRVLHEAQKLKNKKWFIAELAENAENNFLNSEIPKKNQTNLTCLNQDSKEEKLL